MPALLPEYSLRVIQRIGQAATRYHLWCAEQELRAADTSALSPASRLARGKNLDLLCNYRRRGEFPRNRRNLHDAVPCFVDAEGRHCAVAHLMQASGDGKSALMVAEGANYARLRQMYFPELDAWASESGLTKAELARIQPPYAPTPEELNRAYDFLYAIWLVGSLAITSILMNSLRLVVVFAHRFNTSLIGFIAGAMLLVVCFHTNLGQIGAWRLARELSTYRLISIGIACLALLLAAIPFFWRPRERGATTPRKRTGVPETAITAIPPRRGTSQNEPIALEAPWKRSTVELVTAMILAIAFLIGPALVYFKVIGPANQARFARVHDYGHGGVVLGVAFNGDGSRMVSAGDDGATILWDAKTGKRLRTFYRGHTDGITSVAISGDGERVVTGSMDHTAVLWNASSGEKLCTFRGHSWFIDSVAISRDAKLVLTGSSDKTAILWDAAAGQKLRTFEHSLVVSSVALSADASRAVTGSYDKTAILWDTATGKKLQTFGGHADFISCVAMSDDARYVATGSWDKTACLWEAATGKKLQSFRGHEHRVLAVALSSDARLLVTGSTDDSAILWDTATGKILDSFHRHIRPVTCVALTNDSKRLATGSGDFTAMLWDTETGRRLFSFGSQP